MTLSDIIITSPTLGQVVSLITGMIALIAAVLGFINKKQLSTVHVLVNSRLQEALEKIVILEAKLSAAKSIVQDYQIPPSSAPPPITPSVPISPTIANPTLGELEAKISQLEQATKNAERST